MVIRFFVLFALLHPFARFYFRPLPRYSAICIFDPSSSLISEQELKKFTALFGKVKWVENVSEDIKGYKYLILSKGNLSSREKAIIYNFLKNGGGLALFIPRSYDEKFYNKLGVYTYTPLKNRIEEIEINELLTGWNSYNLDFHKGIIIKTGYGGEIIPPTRGNVFPERIPARDFQILISGRDKDKNIIVSGAVLVKHFYNPWDIKEKKPLNWLILSARNYNCDDSFYKKLYVLLTRRAYIKDLKSELPVYYLKESPRIMVKIDKSGKGEVKIKAILEIYNQEGKRIYSSQRRKILTTSGSITFTPVIDFKPGIYSFKLLLYHQGRLIDKAENIFLYAPDKILEKRSALKLNITEGKFLINGQPEFIWGVNYYESRRGELNWLCPDLYSINEDFRLMSKLGLKMVRIHYHHPKWFYDYVKKFNSPLLKFFSQKNYLPDEEDLRILDAIIYLAQLNDLVICLDLFTLVPEEMGDPQGWLGMTARIEDQDKVKHQLEFVKLIAGRYKNIPGISWDLWNEPRVGEDNIPLLREWAERIINEFRKNGDRHLITLGGNDSIYLKDILDYLSIHGESVRFPEVKSLNIPVILQEFWLPYPLSGEKEQGEELRRVLNSLKDTNYQGFLPWQWTRQARLWDSSQPEEWDDNLGLFLREDGSVKPTFFIFQKWISEP